MEQQAAYQTKVKFDHEDEMKQIEFKLYLGQQMNLPDGTQQAVDKNNLRAFLRFVAEPSLKNYTIMQATGTWEGCEEFTIILIHIGPDEMRETVKHVGQVYKRQFLQEAVLMTESIIVTTTI